MERLIHLVGSLPANNAEQAMRFALEGAGKYLRSLTDGETGGAWIVPIIEELRSHPNLKLRTDGDWSSYTQRPVFAVRRGETLPASSLDFGRISLFEKNYPLFKQLRAEAGYPDLSYQVGIAGDFDMAFFTLGLSGAIRHRRSFTQATVHEIQHIHARAGDDVLFQLELPVELVFATKAPGFLLPAVSRFLAQSALRLITEAPAGARFGIHLCLGDLNNRALGRLSTTAPLVALSNAIANAWPQDKKLEYVHVPLAAGEMPPPLDKKFYRDLEQMQLPEGTGFIAGFAHEKQSFDDQCQVLEWIEHYIGQPVDISSACGLGRRTKTAAKAVLEQSIALTHVGREGVHSS